MYQNLNLGCLFFVINLLFCSIAVLYCCCCCLGSLLFLPCKSWDTNQWPLTKSGGYYPAEGYSSEEPNEHFLIKINFDMKKS